MAERDRKKWLLGASVLVLAMLGLVWSEEEAPAPLVAKDAPMQANKEPKKKEGRWKILGAEEAAKEQSLKDPFSLLHEERGHTGKTVVSSVSQASTGAEMIPEIPIEEKEGKGKKDTAWTLKGVVSGEKERLAIVSDGAETRTVAVGETFGDRVVTAIGEDFLSFSDGDGSGELRLPGF